MQVLIRKVHDAICKQGRKDRVIWFSLAEDINQALRAYDSSIPNIVSVGSMLKVRAGRGGEGEKGRLQCPDGLISRS